MIGESIFTVFKYRGLRHITTSEGLAAEWISAIAKGPNGDIWVGGPEGIFRIDEQTVTPLPLDNDVDSQGHLTIAVAPNEDIWVSYYNQDFGFRGLYHFNGREWLQYPEMFDLPGRITLLGVAPNGETWFSNQNGLISYDGHDWQQNALADGPIIGRVNGIYFPTAGGIWFTTLDPSGLVYFDGEEWEQIDDAPVSYGTTFDTDEDGAVWIGNFDGGVSHYDGSSP